MIRAVTPQPLLRPFVRSFGFREAVVTQLLRFPIPARTLSFVEFYLRDRYRVADFATGAVTSAPGAVVLGPQTRRLADLHLRGDYAVFTIHFRPTGFHRLFGVPMTELTDRAVAADALLGGAVRDLHERLQDATGLAERVRLAEEFLLRRATRLSPGAADAPPVAWAAHSLLAGRGLPALDHLRAASGLSLRQLERQFDRYVGMPPRRYARIVRFQHALTVGRDFGEGNGARVAAEAGYFDQTHLIRDFRAFAGQTPTDFRRAVRAAGAWDAPPDLDPDE